MDSKMSLRIPGFILAAALLVAYRLIKPRTRPSEPADRWNLSTLLLASALTLFAELALIRWVSTEVRVFAYVKNLALLLCFLGFGLGCALARQRKRWQSAATALVGLVVIVRLPWRGPQIMESLSEYLGASKDIEIWATGTRHDTTGFLLAVAVTTLLLLLITYIFIPIGQTVSRQIELAPRPLYGYSWNLAGSLVGILAFFAVSWLALPPALWFSIVLAGMALLQSTPSSRIRIAAAVVPVALLLVDPSTLHHFNLWTPYQQIEVADENFPDGELSDTQIRVNHTGYQTIVNLSPDFLARHPSLLAESPDENPYNLPFRFAEPNPSVLIVGSGTGNDVAAALRHHARSVDAVEIDPTILALGRSRHPEHPYDDPRVLAHPTDARAFMKRTTARYDLILFGLLDSHTQLSDYSNMRLDNFVYTEESFREARALLGPNGVLFLKFQINHRFVGKRLAEMLTSTFGKAPVVFLAPSTYTAGASCFAISTSAQVDASLGADPRLREFVRKQRPSFLDLPEVAVTTDDWPYLYHQGHWIPGIFYLLSALVILLATIFYFQIPEARTRVPSLFFFSMGAGFLLLETQVVSRLALYFGTTWQVNGIVIAAVLSALLLANLAIEKQKNETQPPASRRSWMLTGILLGIACAYFLPFHRIPGSATLVGSVAAIVFAIPVFFAGLLFASEFRSADSPAAALGANMLGAVVGGLLENLSLIVGMKALLLLAALLYSLAALGFRGLGRAAQRIPPDRTTTEQQTSAASRKQVGGLSEADG
jgi:SAM-dependent methyltransferase